MPKKLLNVKTDDYYAMGNSKREKLFSVKTDVNLNFNNQISDLCKKS